MSLVLHKIAYPNGILPLLQTSETGRLNSRISEVIRHVTLAVSGEKQLRRSIGDAKLLRNGTLSVSLGSTSTASYDKDISKWRWFR